MRVCMLCMLCLYVCCLGALSKVCMYVRVDLCYVCVAGHACMSACVCYVMYVVYVVLCVLFLYVL